MVSLHTAPYEAQNEGGRPLSDEGGGRPLSDEGGGR